MIGALAHSGRVIFSAAAVMVAVFLTFALSGPLPPKEMGGVHWAFWQASLMWAGMIAFWGLLAWAIYALVTAAPASHPA